MNKIAALQMTSTDDLQANLAQAEALLLQAQQAGAKLAVLPEVFAFYGDKKRVLELAADEAQTPGVIRQFVADQAAKSGLFIVAGSIASQADDECGNKPVQSGKAFASSYLFGPDGRELACYNKLHLFDADVGDAQGRYRESDTYLQGRSVVDYDIGFAHLGLSICYDLRFPELYRYLYQRGANLLVVSAAFTQLTGEAHWLPLLRARAIENNAYVIAANQVGWHNSKRQSFGSSCIISPWGEVLAVQEQGQGVVVAEFDVQQVQRQRQRFPLLQHQRLSIKAL